MATVLLAAAGSAIGGSIGGSFLGIGAAALGKAVGATAGALIDQKILGSGAAAVETGRARALHLQTSTEGASIPVVFGRMRVAGQVIWSTRFKEHVGTSSQGGKATGGGQKVREYSYTISLAIALCEGEIDRIGRIWADGKPYRPDDAVMRVHRGTEDQMPDPKIEAVEGPDRAPAYRGTAYVVFEDLPLGPFGNRIPQFGFEVYRSPRQDLPVDPEERGEPLSELVKGVALLPGTGEFALSPEPCQYRFAAGGAQYANVNNSEGRPDMLVALDQLDRDLPDCGAVSLIVCWFGSDLRVGHCRVEPKVEESGRTSTPYAWTVAGLDASQAEVVSGDVGRPNFGGTPADRAVIDAIRELKARGKRVMLYPFLLMDIPAGNGLPDPYGGAEQAAFPWRGRITLEAAPGQPGSSDQTAAAADEVAAFFGTARAADYAVEGNTVSYSGPQEWSWRRFVLHLAALGQAAGGVESICVGTELRGITTIRESRTSYPAVSELVDLAGEVRQLLPDAKLSYAADWSEYFGHQAADGSGDAIFHLDPLWSHPEIDFVGIDDYTPLSDWRHSSTHLDREAGASSVYSLGYLKSNVEGGEHHDFYYASFEDRQAQNRLPVTDGAYGEDWIYRPKDIRGWWSNPHHDRVGGIRQETATAWQPGMKPVRLTETGCPASDLGANQPNVFWDGKSSESALPHFSRGARDDEMQRRFLQAKLGYWADPAKNPQSAVYGGSMIEDSYVWAWDARPWPDFPLRESVWADGPAYRIGHWISGRIGGCPLAEVVAEICVRAGFREVDVGALHGAVAGYMIDGTRNAREALQPLMLAYGFDAFESAGKIVFAMRGRAAERRLEEESLVAAEESGPVERVRESAGEAVDAVRVSFMLADGDYRVAAAEASLPGSDGSRMAETSLPLAMSGSSAAALAERWLAESSRVRDSAQFVLPPSKQALEPADSVTFEVGGRVETFRIERITEGEARSIEAARVEPTLYLPDAREERSLEPPVVVPAGPVEAVFLDLPLANGTEIDHQPWLAVCAEPWDAMAVYRSAGAGDFEHALDLRRPALIGRLLDPLAPAEPDRWARMPARLALRSDALQSRERLAVLNGGNRLAVELVSGEWEILQFREAVLTAPGEITVSTLLRGQRGTAPLVGNEVPAGARVVVLDDAVVPVPIAREELELPRTYRIGPARHGYGHASYLEMPFAARGVGLRPFAPAHLRARKSSSGDLAIAWVRTSRVGGDSWRATEVPLAEERELYRVRILAGGEVLRVAETASAAFTYDAGMQSADGAAGEIELRVAQLSTTFGYGPERMLIANV